MLSAKRFIAGDGGRDPAAFAIEDLGLGAPGGGHLVLQAGEEDAAASCYAQPEARGPHSRFSLTSKRVGTSSIRRAISFATRERIPHLPDAKTWRELESYLLGETRGGSRNSCSAEGLGRLHR
jgi:hypothetical protein